MDHRSNVHQIVPPKSTFNTPYKLSTTADPNRESTQMSHNKVKTVTPVFVPKTSENLIKGLYNYTVLWKESLSDGQQFHQYQQKEQPPLTGQQFHQYQQKEQPPLTGQQFHQYQQKEQPPLTSNNWRQEKPKHMALEIQVLASDRHTIVAGFNQSVGLQSYPSW